MCASVPMTQIFFALLRGFGKSTCWELSVELPSHFKMNSEKTEKSQILSEVLMFLRTQIFMPAGSESNLEY